jgi:hypothetical protein
MRIVERVVQQEYSLHVDANFCKSATQAVKSGSGQPARQQTAQVRAAQVHFHRDARTERKC